MRLLVLSILLVCSVLPSKAQSPNFSANVTSGCAPLTVQFQDQTSGSSAWLWDLGKGAGSTSILQNPSAIYTEPGIYTVSLTVNGSTNTKIRFIEVFAKPMVDWSFVKQGSCSPLKVDFTNLSQPGSGSLSEFEWFFGDGAVSSEMNPSHIYENAGTYTVSLSVKNSHGCQSLVVKETSVIVEGTTAAFTVDHAEVCQAPATLQFTNTSQGVGTLTYDWSFGDGTASQEKNPAHIFLNAGVYEVTLVASNASGCVGKTKKTVTIGSGGNIDFTSTLQKACVGQPISFSSQANANVLSRLWRFGDGTTSTLASPSVAYGASGTYEVVLEAQLEGEQCASIIKKEIEIVVEAHPQFKFEQSCGRKVKFESTSTHVTQVAWSFGDNATSTETKPEHIYAASGRYTVRLTGFNELSCPSFLEKEIVVSGDPVAAFSPDRKQDCVEPSLSGCAPFTLFLEDKSVSDLPATIRWKFSDGTQSDNLNVTKTYASKGVYEALLTVTNSLGCKDTAKAKIYVADTKPVAKLEFDKKSVCVGEIVHFKDVSTNSNFSCWRFGDELAGTAKEFDYAFTKPGTYVISLTSKNDGCSSQVTSPDVIEVKNPFVDFSIEKNCTDPYTISLTNLSEQYHAIQWDLGDGSQSASEAFTHTYPLGSYVVKLKASNTETGCEVTAEKPVFIQDVKANFDVSQTDLCKLQPVIFSDKSEFAVTREWLFSDGVISTDLNPVRTYDHAGTYGARLLVTDSDGCTDEITLAAAVQVIDITGDFSFSSTSTCDKMITTFQDRSVGQPAITEWNWEFGEGKLSSDQNPVHEFTTLGSYSVKLSLTNALGKCSIMKENAVVFTNPTPNMALIKDEYCVGDPVTFINLSENASQFAWQFGDGSTSTSPLPVKTFSTAGVYDVTLSAKDIYGCELSMTRSAAVKIRKPVASFEAFQTSAECPPLVTAFVNHSSPEVVNWQWDFGDGQFSTLSTPSNTYRKPGVYDVSLVVKDAIGCSDTMKLSGIISVGGPFGSYNYVTSICTEQALEFSAETTNALVHRWDYGDGKVEEREPLVQHAYAKAGKFRPVLLLIDSKGCQVPIDDGPELSVYDHPIIDFTVSPEFPFLGETVELAATRNEAALLSWNWPEATATGDTVQMQFPVDGTLAVTVYAVNDHGCGSVVTKNVRVQKDIHDLPNVFTPSLQDDKNDRFEIPEVEGGTWRLLVYNRWGNLIYTEDEYQNDWDANGVSGGVYYYRLQNNLRKERQLKGFVHVMK